jgi:hypothetical protein
MTALIVVGALLWLGWLSWLSKGEGRGASGHVLTASDLYRAAHVRPEHDGRK